MVSITARAQQRVPTRTTANPVMELSLLFDIGHSKAFQNAGRFHTALLDQTNFAFRRATFYGHGLPRG